MSSAFASFQGCHYSRVAAPATVKQPVHVCAHLCENGTCFNPGSASMQFGASMRSKRRRSIPVRLLLTRRGMRCGVAACTHWCDYARERQLLHFAACTSHARRHQPLCGYPHNSVQNCERKVCASVRGVPVFLPAARVHSFAQVRGGERSVEVEKSMRVLNCASHKLGRAAGTAATRGGCSVPAGADVAGTAWQRTCAHARVGCLCRGVRTGVPAYMPCDSRTSLTYTAKHEFSIL